MKNPFLKALAVAVLMLPGLALAQPQSSFDQDEGTSLINGYQAFSASDWNSAAFFLRKAVMDPSNDTPESWYMIIMSQVYMQDWENAIRDADVFLMKFPDSSLRPNIQYQKGKALYCSGDTEAAVNVLADFCHQNPDSQLYPSALFWIAESFFGDYDFDTAGPLYGKIVESFPDSEKIPEAKARLHLIAQRDREEKLLYLLKVTGEEYLNSKEDYERRIHELQTAGAKGLPRKLQDAQERIAELEAGLKEALEIIGHYEEGRLSPSQAEYFKSRGKSLKSVLNTYVGSGEENE